MIKDFSSLPLPKSNGNNLSVLIETDKDIVVQKGYRYGEGIALAVVKPRTIQEVQAVAAYCNKNKISIVPQGGNTGLVGASVPDSSGKMLVLNTSLLNNKMMQVDFDSKSVNVGAGVILQKLNDYLEEYNLTLPIDIGSKESCQIGGLLATKAAGTRSGRYGNAAKQTISYKVVLANGELKEFKVDYESLNVNGLLQDNSRIDFSQPFLGSGGYFGIIVEAKMRLTIKPNASDTILVVPKSFSVIPEIKIFLQERLGDSFTAFESINDVAMRLTSNHLKVTYPLAYENGLDDNPISLLIEISSETENIDKLNHILWGVGGIIESLAEADLITAAPKISAHDLWHIRHHITDAIRRRGNIIMQDVKLLNLVISHDISVYPGTLGRFEQEVCECLKKHYDDKVEIYAFGHRMIDAIHFNVVWNPKYAEEYSEELKQEIRNKVLEIATNDIFLGSVSAEHGLGPYTVNEINKFSFKTKEGKAYLEELNRIKMNYDPNKIMNPMVFNNITKTL